MNKSVLAAVAGFGLIAASAAFADDAAPMAPTPASATGGDKVVCHVLTHEGSLMHKGECHTQKEWDNIRFQDQQAIYRWQAMSLTFNQGR